MLKALKNLLGSWPANKPARWVAVHAIQDTNWQNENRRYLRNKCGLATHNDMHPVQLKPNTDIAAQVIIYCHAVDNRDANGYHNHKTIAMKAVLKSYARLASNTRWVWLLWQHRYSVIREIHFGGWIGRSPAELAELNAELLTRFWCNPVKFPPPKAECLADFKRVLSAWHNIFVRYVNQYILLITYGGVIRMILCHFLQHPIKRLLEIEVSHAAM